LTLGQPARDRKVPIPPALWPTDDGGRDTVFSPLFAQPNPRKGFGFFVRKRKKKMSQFNVLIVHGVHGYPQKNWYGWIADELRAQGHNVVVPQLPTRLLDEDAAALFAHKPLPKILASYEKQKFSIWRAIAEKTLKKWKPERTIIIGHSLGGLTALRLAERTPKPFAAIIAASPVGGPVNLPDEAPDLKSFYEAFDGYAVRKGARKIVVFVGSDDIIVLPEQSHRIAKLCRADEVIALEKGGHLNADSGYKTFPELLRKVEEIISESPLCYSGSTKTNSRSPATNGETYVPQR
jgi:predicted alpha/beta hydrolase family esterase